MGIRVYDYECDCGIWEAFVDYEERDENKCGTCGKGQRLMGCPAIHTLESHMRGYRDDNTTDSKETGQGYWNPAHGEFIDENLTDPATGEPMRYSTLKQKRECLKKAGKYELGDNDKGKATAFGGKRRGKKIHFTKEGDKTSQVS
jgi:hypothetical protein